MMILVDFLNIPPVAAGFPIEFEEDFHGFEGKIIFEWYFCPYYNITTLISPKLLFFFISQYLPSDRKTRPGSKIPNNGL